MDIALKDDYKEDIAQKLSFGRALRVSLWIFAIFACVAGIGISVVAGAAAYFAIGNVAYAALEPMDSAHDAILDLASAVSEFEGSEYVEAAGNMSVSLEKMADGMEDMSYSVSSMQSIPLIGEVGGISSASLKIEQSAQKMRSAAQSVSGAYDGLEDAIEELESVEEDLYAAAKSVEESKKRIAETIFILQICIVGFTLAVECMFGCTLGVALSYGPPAKKEKK